MTIFLVPDEVVAEMPKKMEGILDGMGRLAKALPFELVSRDM